MVLSTGLVIVTGWFSLLFIVLLLYLRLAGVSSEDILGLGDLKPYDPKEIATHVLKQSQEGRVPAYWVLKRNIFRPVQCRKIPHVAIAYMTQEMMAKDQCELRYHDGYKTIISVDELAKGTVISPANVSQRWEICQPGFRDLKGILHEK